MATEQNIGTEAGSFGGGIAFNSQYNTPTITTKSQNNYSIPNLEAYNVLIFTGSTDIDLKGLDSSGLTEWNGYIILNGNASGGKKLNIKRNQNGSLAGNRFFMKDDINLEPGDLWWIVYNQDQQRWNAQAKL